VNILAVSGVDLDPMHRENGRVEDRSTEPDRH
jgi:hypothetical protein